MTCFSRLANTLLMAVLLKLWQKKYRSTRETLTQGRTDHFAATVTYLLFPTNVSFSDIYGTGLSKINLLLLLSEKEHFCCNLDLWPWLRLIQESYHAIYLCQNVTSLEHTHTANRLLCTAAKWSIIAKFHYTDSSNILQMPSEVSKDAKLHANISTRLE